jgi:NAD(P)-dependent dehydrogenase (short-subunit alcohol dehydrogenase family)
VGRPQIVVVTGAAGGIGRAVARAFGARGATVGVIAACDEGLGITAEVVRQVGGTPVVLPCDVADHDQVATAVDRVETGVGPIDVWVNVALPPVFAPFDQVSPAEYRRATEVTYLGYVWGMWAVLPRMKARDRGTIVHVGSALACRGILLQSPYCGARHAIQGFHEALRCELLHEKSHVRVTMVQMMAVGTPQPELPVHRPEAVARRVLFAAAHPQRPEYRMGSGTAAPLGAAAAAQLFGPATLTALLARHRYRA